MKIANFGADMLQKLNFEDDDREDRGQPYRPASYNEEPDNSYLL